MPAAPAVATVLFFAWAYLLTRLGRRWQIEDAAVQLVAAVAMTAVVWLPSMWRNLAIAVFLAVLLFSFRQVVWGLLVGVAVFLVGLWAPLLPIVLLLGILAAVGVGMVREHRRRLRVLDAMPPLAADTPEGTIVALRGKAGGISIAIPGREESCVAWQVLAQNGKKEHVQRTITVLDAQGAPLALVDLVEAEVDLGADLLALHRTPNARKLRHAAHQAARSLATALRGMAVLRHGAELTAVGPMTREMMPPELSGYRGGGGSIAVLRKKSDEKVWLTDLQPELLLVRARWVGLAWGGWGAACALVAGLQLAGIL